MTLTQIIKDAINKQLLLDRGNQVLAAKHLDISRGTLRKYMDQSFKERVYVKIKNNTKLVRIFPKLETLENILSK